MRLSESLSAYLCHEMAGPLSTLAAVLELGEEPDEALELANAAMARLRFLRAAWAGGAGALDAAALSRLAAGLPGADRCRVEIGGARTEDAARLTLCLLPVAVMALPRGGVIGVAGPTITLAGQSAAWPASFARCLASPDAAWDMAGEPRGLAVPLACLVAGQLRRSVTILSPTALRVA